MRPAALLLAMLPLVMAAPALAAPTCQTVDGDTIRCGTPGAMPVRWKPSPEHLMQVQQSRPVDPTLKRSVLGVAGGLVLLFALIALLPRFDGSKPGDWDRQEDDGDAPR